MGIFTGTGVAMITPFDAQGNVDVAALRRITTHLIEGKAEYLVVLGTTGESATLTEAEQHQVIETVMESAEKRIPVVLGAGGNDTAAVCKKAEALSRRYAPTGLLSVNPYYNKPTQEGIYQHFKAIAASTDLPVILYNVPGRSASNMLAATTLRLAHEVSNIVAVKEASGNLDQITEIIAQKPAGFQVLAGDDSLALPVAALGGEGVISVIGNALPKPFCELVRLALAGDFAGARHLHYRLLKLMNLNFVEGNPAGVKAMMHLLGICGPDVRLPLVQASDALRAQLKEALAE